MKALILACCVACLVCSYRFGAASAAELEQTWTGEISDSACGAQHEEAAEGAGKMSDRDCTLACVRGGSKYVLVSGGKTIPIANQSFATLPASAGHSVKVTGTLENGAIVVTRIDNPDDDKC
jgi:hypothetical protein